MVNILKGCIAFLLMGGIAFAQIPALKDGELIVVDSILSPAATLQAGDMQPYMLNIVRINRVSDSIPTKEISYEWDVQADGKPIGYLVGIGGDHIGFTFLRASKIKINVIVHAKYEAKDVQYEEAEGGLFKKVENTVEVTRDFAIFEEYQVSNPSPNPDPEPEPDPDPILSGYAKEAYDAFYKYVKPRSNHPKLVESAHKQAAVLRTNSTQIAAGTIKDVRTLLQTTANMNAEVLKELNIPSDVWAEFGVFFQGVLYTEYENGTLVILQDYQRVFGELAKGLEAVK